MSATEIMVTRMTLTTSAANGDRPGRAVKVTQAYKFALDPTPAQERALRSHAGAARFAWNWGLAKCIERYEAEGKWYSGIELTRTWNADKKSDPALAWWVQNSKCAYQEALRDLGRALHDFTRSKRGQRKGKRLGFPRFKRRGKCRDSFRLYGSLRCNRATVTLPRLGTIATHESTRKLSRRLENGSARILSATVSRTAQRWCVSFTVEVDREVPEKHARPGRAIGVDLGVRTLLTGVDDSGNVVTVAGPKPLRAGLRKLRRASRSHSRKQAGSARSRKSAARLARIHAKVTAMREDALHKATTMLAREYESVIAEDLNVAGMTRNRGLARSVNDQGFGAVRRMLAYKTTWNGGVLITADRWFPSSKKCSSCGAVKAKLPLRERAYCCEHCGHHEDRDVNAARNLLYLAASGAESEKRPWKDGKTASRAARLSETGTRHRASGQDRDRPKATRDCGMSVLSGSSTTGNGVSTSVFGEEGGTFTAVLHPLPRAGAAGKLWESPCRVSGADG
jgi:putative transposase